MTDVPPQIFDRQLYRLRRERASTTIEQADFLHRRAMADIVDRLESIVREFPTAGFFGAGTLIDMLTPECGVGDIVQLDFAAGRLPHNRVSIIADDEALPLAPGKFDLLVSVLTLHHANDLIGALAQMRLALKPDGLMLAVMFGEDTLVSVRQALYQAEAQVTGGVSPRITPFGHVRDLGSALQRAGFNLPVADIDTVNVTYRDPMTLYRDLRAMGETAVFADRPKALRRDAFFAALQEQMRAPEIRFDLVTLTGWAPSPDQPKPLKPGSAKHSLAEAVKKAGDQV